MSEKSELSSIFVPVLYQDPNGIDTKLWTILEVCKICSFPCLVHFIKKDDRFGRTPLINATILNRLDLMVLYNYDEEMINRIDYFGNTALHYAAGTGFIQGVIYLLKKQCFLEMFNFNAMSPLMLAVLNGHHAVAEILLLRGASAYYHSEGHDNALNLALQMHYLVTLMLMQDSCISQKLEALYLASSTVAEHELFEYISVLHKAGLDLRYRSTEAISPVNISIGKRNLQMVEVWLQLGANADRYDWDLTPLMKATVEGYLEICDILIRYGARVVAGDTGNSLDETPQQLACVQYLRSKIPPYAPI